MNNFDKLYNTLIMEIDWRKLANRIPGQIISGAGKAIAGAGSLASKATGAVGYGLGVGGRSVPGTGAVQSAIGASTGAIGSGMQTAGKAFADFSAKQVDSARQAKKEKIEQQLGISTKSAPKSGDTVSINLGRFAGKGLGILVNKAALQKPVAYEGGQLYTIPLKGVSAGNTGINSLKVLYNTDGKGAAQLFYFDQNNMPVQNSEELGLNKIAALKPNPDQKVTKWILSDKQPAEPEELNVRAARGKAVKSGSVIPISGYGGKVQQYKILTDPDSYGNFIAIKI